MKLGEAGEMEVAEDPSDLWANKKHRAQVADDPSDLWANKKHRA